MVAPRTVAEGAETRFAPVRYGDYLMERIDANYDYRNDLETAKGETEG